MILYSEYVKGQEMDVSETVFFISFISSAQSLAIEKREDGILMITY